jgi:hypothetical protein
MLPVDELIRRFDRVLTVATALTAQMTEEILWERAIDSRDRPVIGLVFHTIDLCPKLLDGYETATLAKSTQDQRPESLDSTEKLVDFAKTWHTNFLDWWDREADVFDVDREWETYYGRRNSHRVLERQVWHTAQHTRQLREIIARNGIEPADELSAADLDKLPLPTRLWE